MVLSGIGEGRLRETEEKGGGREVGREGGRGGWRVPGLAKKRKGGWP